jgi:hypothetical protein
MESLVQLAGEGPRGAEVQRVEVLDEDPEGLSSFEVR